MLSRPPAAGVNGPCHRDFLRAIVHNAPQSTPRQLRRGTASFASQGLQARRNTSRSSIQPPYSKRYTQKQAGFLQTGKRFTSTSAPDSDAPQSSRKDEIYSLIDNIKQNEARLAELLEDLDLLDEHYASLNTDDTDLDDAFSETIGHRSEQVLESRVRSARQRFGEVLPEGYLNDTEMQLYTRLYGEPIVREDGYEAEEEADDEADADQLLREDGQGGWEEVEFEREGEHDDIPVVYDMEAAPEEVETETMKRTREVAEQLGGEIMREQFEDEAVPDSAPRRHPLTMEGKFSTDPSTIFMPKDSVVYPITAVLSNYSNKHIREVSRSLFGGARLPHSTTTLPPRYQLPQLPIPLEAQQRYMSEMEGNAYLAVLYPGIYASILSVLVEVRKRLGSSWIQRLLEEEGGPNVLDASGGGAGILAWRDVLRAEWERMHPDHNESDPIPMGRSTVVTGSDALRVRAAVILENTTFLPRLPDYVHVREAPTLDDVRTPKRKQYDIIIAPHSLLGIQDDWVRKEHVENLWSLLNPDGGVLILLEKGRQRGFEAVAGAREMLLKRHIASPGSTEYEDFLDSPGDNRTVQKEPGMIIAPCTNHGTCPMYRFPGVGKGRVDYCHFQQRYIRPPFLQRIVGSKDRNHEDVQFSYLAVQRGVDLRERLGIKQGAEASQAAFDGYGNLTEDNNSEQPETSDNTAAAATTAGANEMTPEASTASQNGETNFHTLSLPRMVYPPMKRRGHVIADLCTPEAKIERWIVPRSYSRTAYRDARKSQWGDLWALGAKTRLERRLELGQKHGEGKKERLERRAAIRAAMREEEDAAAEEGTAPAPKKPELPIMIKEKGQTIPSWLKKRTKKQTRQTLKKRHAVDFDRSEDV